MKTRCKWIKIPRSVWMKVLFNKNYGKYETHPMQRPKDFFPYATPAANEEESQKVIAALEGQGFYNSCLREDGSSDRLCDSGNNHIGNHRTDDMTDAETHKSDDSYI